MSKEKEENEDGKKFKNMLTIAISYKVPVTNEDLKKKNQKKKGLVKKKKK